METYHGMELKPALKGYRVPEELQKVLLALATSVADIADIVRTGSVAKIGSTNSFGDAQLEMDVKADQAVFHRLKESGVVEVASSEETPTVEQLGGKGFAVAFDPLDGSSVVDANFSFGSIFGIWPGSDLVGIRGRGQAAACIAVYGPRTTVVMAVPKHADNPFDICFEATYQWDGRWTISKRKLSIEDGKTFAPGNLRATAELPNYRKLVEFWIDNKYTLRYTGALVPDVYHILMKSQGVVCNPASKASPAKLRILYEAAPIGLVVECAGGASSDGRANTESVLDVEITELEQRCTVCYGSKGEVRRFNEYRVMDI